MTHSRILAAVLQLALLVALLPAAAWGQSYSGPAVAVPLGLATPSQSVLGTDPQVPAYAPGPATTWSSGLQPPPYGADPSAGLANPADGFALPASSAFHWMLSAEALWLERVDDRSVILGNTVYNSGGGLSFVNDILTSTDVDFPLATGVRLGVGYRFSPTNSLELSYFGLQQWSVGRTIYGDPVGNSVLAFSPWTQTDYLIDGFNNQLGYTYQSSLNNAELNDRFIAMVDGNWSLAGLVGFRYVNVSDKFNLNGSDVSTGDFENLDIHTSNNLYGPQVGLEWIDNWTRFQLTTSLKAAVCANSYSQHYSNLNSSGVINGNPVGFVPYDFSNSGTGVSGVFEISVMGRYRVAEHFWIKGGYQTYFITGLALGPMQLANWSHGNSISLDGPSLGIEMNW